MCCLRLRLLNLLDRYTITLNKRVCNWQTQKNTWLYMWWIHINSKGFANPMMKARIPNSSSGANKNFSFQETMLPIFIIIVHVLKIWTLQCKWRCQRYEGYELCWQTQSSSKFAKAYSCVVSKYAMRLHSPTLRTRSHILPHIVCSKFGIE